jgi:hypothetical protein
MRGYENGGVVAASDVEGFSCPNFGVVPKDL